MFTCLCSGVCTEERNPEIMRLKAYLRHLEQKGVGKGRCENEGGWRRETFGLNCKPFLSWERGGSLGLLSLQCKTMALGNTSLHIFPEQFTTSTFQSMFNHQAPFNQLPVLCSESLDHADI